MKKCTFFNARYLFAIALACTACSIDIEVTDKTLNSSPPDFSNAEDFSYDANYVEIKGGKVSLKPLDLEHSGDDFARGNHVGTSLDSQSSNLQFVDKLSTSLRIESFLPLRAANLVAYWSGDNSFEESVNSDNLSVFGALSISNDSKVGSGSMLFDGTNSYGLFSASNLPQGSAPRTIAFWMKMNGNATQVLFRYGEPSNGQFIEFAHFNSGELSIGPGGHSFRFQWANDGNWHLMTYVFPDGETNSDKWKLYIDGVEMTNGYTALGSARTIETVNSLGRIGANPSLTSFFDGQMDEFTIYDVALASNEIRKIYEIQSLNYTELSSTWTPKWENIVGYWKMDGNWQDSSGNGNNGTPNGAMGFSTNSAVGSSSGSFDGTTDDNIYVTNSSELQVTDFSGSAWFKQTALPNVAYVYAAIFSRGNNDGNGNAVNFLLFSRNASNKLGLRISNGVSSIECNAVDGENLNTGWHHAAFTAKYNGSTSTQVKLYFDGKLSDTCTISGQANAAATGDIAIGAWQTGPVPNNSYGNFPGEIDDVALWDIALTDSNIVQIYNRQKQKYAGSYDSEVIDLGSSTSNWPDLSWSTNLPFGKELVGDFDNDGNSDIESSSDYSVLTGNLSNGLVGHWSFLEEVPNSAMPGSKDFSDRSGGLSHGEESGGVTLGVRGIVGAASSFDGVDDIITIVNNPLLQTSYNDNFSLSQWIKVPPTQNDLGNTLNRIGLRFTTGGSDGFSVTNSTHGQPGSLVFGRYDGVTPVNIFSNKLINDNKFHHILVKKEGGIIYLFIDGVLDSQAIDPTTLNEQFNSYILGRNQGGTSAFLGLIDETSVWSRALSNSEIQQLYRRGANRVKFQVKSCVDTSCNCKSFSSSPAGSVNDCDGDGIANATDYDDIHQAEYMGPGGDGTTYFSELMNRDIENIAFDCDANTSDSNPDICVQDEILLTGSPKPTSPMFSFDDYLEAAAPQPNRYFQYRVNMEADENTACDGEPCLPELTSVRMGKSDEPRYYGITQTIESQKSIAYRDIQSVSVEADSCVGFQLSPDKENYYFWNGQAWAVAPADDNRSTASEVQDNIVKYSEQFQNGELYFKAFLSSDTTTPCELGKINLNYRRQR